MRADLRVDGSSIHRVHSSFKGLAQRLLKSSNEVLHPLLVRCPRGVVVVVHLRLTFWLIFNSMIEDSRTS